MTPEPHATPESLVAPETLVARPPWWERFSEPERRLLILFSVTSFFGTIGASFPTTAWDAYNVFGLGATPTPAIGATTFSLGALFVFSLAFRSSPHRLGMFALGTIGALTAARAYAWPVSVDESLKVACGVGSLALYGSSAALTVGHFARERILWAFLVPTLAGVVAWIVLARVATPSALASPNVLAGLGLLTGGIGMLASIALLLRVPPPPESPLRTVSVTEARDSASAPTERIVPALRVAAMPRWSLLRTSALLTVAPVIPLALDPLAYRVDPVAYTGGTTGVFRWLAYSTGVLVFLGPTIGLLARAPGRLGVGVRSYAGLALAATFAAVVLPIVLPAARAFLLPSIGMLSSFATSLAVLLVLRPLASADRLPIAIAIAGCGWLAHFLLLGRFEFSDPVLLGLVAAAAFLVLILILLPAPRPMEETV